jgi:hypothetical protein
MGRVEEAACGCGRQMPVLQILGRASDFLVNGSHAYPVHPLLDALLDALPVHLRGRTRLRQDRPGRVTVEVAEGVHRDLQRAREVAADLLGDGWRVEAVAIGRWGRLPSGKVSYFVRDDAGAVRHE